MDILAGASADLHYLIRFPLVFGVLRSADRWMNGWKYGWTGWPRPTPANEMGHPRQRKPMGMETRTELDGISLVWASSLLHGAGPDIRAMSLFFACYLSTYFSLGLPRREV